jgi:hypothetical protein
VQKVAKLGCVQKMHQLSVVGYVEGAVYMCGQLNNLCGSWC